MVIASFFLYEKILYAAETVTIYDGWVLSGDQNIATNIPGLTFDVNLNNQKDQAWIMFNNGNEAYANFNRTCDLTRSGIEVCFTEKTVDHYDTALPDPYEGTTFSTIYKMHITMHSDRSIAANVIMLHEVNASSVIEGRVVVNITLNNTGEADAANVVLEETFSEGLQLASIPSGCSFVDGKIRWTGTIYNVVGKSCSFELKSLTNGTFATKVTVTYFDGYTNKSLSDEKTFSVEPYPFSVSAEIPEMVLNRITRLNFTFSSSRNVTLSNLKILIPPQFLRGEYSNNNIEQVGEYLRFSTPIEEGQNISLFIFVTPVKIGSYKISLEGNVISDEGIKPIKQEYSGSINYSRLAVSVQSVERTGDAVSINVKLRNPSTEKVTNVRITMSSDSAELPEPVKILTHIEPGAEEILTFNARLPEATLLTFNVQTDYTGAASTYFTDSIRYPELGAPPVRITPETPEQKISQNETPVKNMTGTAAPPEESSGFKLEDLLSGSRLLLIFAGAIFLIMIALFLFTFKKSEPQIKMQEIKRNYSWNEREGRLREPPKPGV
jgi:hypothetical protein